MRNYHFVAECLNGNVIVQDPKDISKLDPLKSSFYDVTKNMPLKSFSLVGKGDIFCVDFRDLSISINEKKYHHQIYPRKPLPDHAKVVLVYWYDTIQIAKSVAGIEKSPVTQILRKFFHTQHFATIPGKYTIGWEAYVFEKKLTDFVMTIDN